MSALMITIPFHLSGINLFPCWYSVTEYKLIQDVWH